MAERIVWDCKDVVDNERIKMISKDDYYERNVGNKNNGLYSYVPKHGFEAADPDQDFGTLGRQGIDA